jgi:hypothetical protein
VTVVTSVFVCANCWAVHSSNASFMDAPCPECDASSSWQRMLVCGVCSTPVFEPEPFVWRHTYEVDTCRDPQVAVVPGLYGRVEGEGRHVRVVKTDSSRVTLQSETDAVRAMRSEQGTYVTFPSRGSKTVRFTLTESYDDDEPTQDT